MEETAGVADLLSDSWREHDLRSRDLAGAGGLAADVPFDSKPAEDRRAGDWRSQVIVGNRRGAAAVPLWMQAAWESLRANLIDAAYPCFYGTQALRANAVYFGLVDGGCIRHLPDTLRHFLRHCRDHPLANFALIFEPDASLDHAAAGARFWSVLKYLQSQDGAASLAPSEPDDPLWEFTFDGVAMFVVGASPTYDRRRSRNLGESMIMLFQPRSVFETGQENGVIGDTQRASIRRRLLAWDGMSHHASLGVYGDPDNREWQQYFLPDGNVAVTGLCPLGHT